MQAITPFLMFEGNAEEAISFYVFYKSLAEGGQVLMPLDTYPFSKKYVWLKDRFGVSWQLGFK